MALDAENRERQASELTLLTSMYPAEFSWRSNPPPDLEEPILADPFFALTLHPSYTIEISLPSTYPSGSKPNVYLCCGDTVSTTHRKESRAALASIVSSQDTDLEILDLIINAFLDILPTFTSADDDTTTTIAPSTTTSPSQGHSHKASTDPHHDQKIKQVTIWSHHLLATSKRRSIQSWSRELGLSGFSRPGHPGAVFAEGEVDQVDEFVRRLKALRWQALQVRVEEVVESRMLDGGEVDAGVVEVESLGEIVEGLRKRDEGAAKRFLEGMKISAAS